MKTLEAMGAESPFLSSQICHADIAAFSDESVNLKREDAEGYREQVRRLREKLDRYAGDHPEYGLIKTLLSGSLAKGTAPSAQASSKRRSAPTSGSVSVKCIMRTCWARTRSVNYFSRSATAPISSNCSSPWPASRRSRS